MSTKKTSYMPITRDNRVAQVDMAYLSGDEVKTLLPNATTKPKRKGTVIATGNRRGDICVLCGEQSMTRVIEGYCVDIIQCEKNAAYLDAESHGKRAKGAGRPKKIHADKLEAFIRAIQEYNE